MAGPAPAASTPSAPPPSGDTGSGDKSWQQAAATAGTGANTPPTQPQAATPNAVPAPPPAVTAVAAPPAEAKPVYAPGLRGFMDKMIDSLAGAPTSKVRQGADGSVYLEHEPVRGQPGFSNGKQWLRIGAEALLGAAAGMSQRGAGSEGQALGAGVQAGEKFQQQRQEAPTQEMMQLANMTALNHQTAKNALELTQANFKLSEDQLKAWNDSSDVANTPGAKLVGHANTLSDVTKFMAQGTEGYDHQDQAQNVTFRSVHAFDKDGKASGFDIYKIPKGVDDEILPPGTPLTTYDEATDKLVQQKTSSPDTRGHINALSIAAKNRFLEVAGKQSEINERNAAADAKNNPPEKTETPSATREHNSVAALNEEKLKRLKTGAELPDGTPNPRFEALAQALYDGDVTPADLKREAKGASLDPNELTARAVQIGQERGKPWSESIIKQEQNFAANEKTQAALKGIDRVIAPTFTDENGKVVPGYMTQMLNRARAAHLGTNGLYNSAELGIRRYFGESTAKNFNTSVTELRWSIAGLIGNPLLGGSETDQKLKQADELIGEKPTLQNLESAAETLNTALGAQKASIIGNNRFLRKIYGSASGQGQQPAPALTNLHTNPTTGQTIGWNGQQYVDTKTGQAVK